MAASRPTAPAQSDLLEGYATFAGTVDELRDQAGNVRPAWGQLIEHLSRLSPADLSRRFARGNQYLRDAGVFYRQYDEKGSTERAWPLSHIPVLIHEDEWRHISRGLIQRAELLEAVAADLYGPNQLVAKGHLPAQLIAMSPEWLRPMCGVRPASGHFLHFLAFEIGRGPKGDWWVLGDRAQAPSGAGFALENRVATSRVFSELYAEANVHRLAGFFQTFRDTLRGLRTNPDSQMAILTPGPHNDTYFEHAYIARYLGFMLLQGEDLTVEDGRVLVRTVSGLQPIDVLWRRMDAGWADPLELNEVSQIGTPGLTEAVRRGQTTLVNALGSGVLETRALLAFLPRICKALRGEPLMLPNIATWWCGQQKERDHVIANADKLMIGPALSSRPPFESDDPTVLGAGLRHLARDAMRNLLDTEGAHLIGQEAVTLSTTPAWVDDRLAPRPMSLRMFLARTPDGWSVMPGGYARIGASQNATAIAMQQGGSVADVWIVSDKPVPRPTMLPSPTTTVVRPETSALPSRAADNLYWMGRYVERAEQLMRLLRAWHVRFSETADAQSPLLGKLGAYIGGYGADVNEGVPVQLRETLAMAINSASKVRDRFSPDGWMALNDLAKSARRMSERVSPGDDAARAMSVLLRKITGFSGLVHDNMHRSTGWRFLRIGRTLERAIAMTATLAAMADAKAPEGALDVALEAGDSTMTYRRRHALDTTRPAVIDLLVLDVLNPRSVLHNVTEIRDEAALLPGGQDKTQMTALSRATLLIHTELSVQTPGAIDTAALEKLRGDLWNVSDIILQSYFS